MMFFQFQEQESLLQNPIFDSLLCEEENVGYGVSDLQEPEIEIHKKGPFSFLLDNDLVWEDEELDGLFFKEKFQHCLIKDDDVSLMAARKDAVKWMVKVIGYYGFHASTAVLAVNYYDRFIASVYFRRDKPWMSQLAAVACLSIAAKMEETQVPLLLDLQVEESKYLFEAKTIQRMELLILSALKWNMNPVNPISFIDHLVRRFNLLTNLHWEFLRKCENVILFTITDCRLIGHYLPSVIAAATMIHVIGEIGSCDGVEYEVEVMKLLRTHKEEIDDCCKVIVEAMGDAKCKKRKHGAVMIPSSPSGVIDAYFNSDSSVDSWAVSSSSSASSSSSTSPADFSKRSRTQLSNGFSVGMGSLPH